MVYKIEDIQNDSSISLSRGGMILFALLSGVDYHKGVDRVGKKIAHGLARCGFGNELLEAYENLRDCKDEFRQFLQQWRMRINIELKENSQGCLLHRTSLSLPDDFPNLDVLEYYTNPVHSGSGGDQGLGSIALRDQKNLNLPKIAQLCEQYFEWGYRAKIMERFVTLMWPCATMHVLRRAALEVDRQNQNASDTSSKAPVPSSQGDVGTPASLVQRYLCFAHREDRYEDVFVNKGTGPRPSAVPVVGANPLICKISGSRQHASTDGLLEYKIEVSPVQLVRIADSGIKGTRQAPPSAEGSNKPKKATETESLPMWVPASMLSVVHPSMVKQFIEKEAEKTTKTKEKRKAREQTRITGSAPDEEDMHTGLQRSQTRPQPQSQLKSIAMGDYDWNTAFEPGHTAVLDPWFTSDALISQAHTERKRSGFFFTLPNPDREDGEQYVNTEAMINNDYDSEVDRPVTGFDLICDRILTKKRKPVKQSKKPRPANVDIPTRAMDERPFKKQRISSRILDALDAPES